MEFLAPEHRVIGAEEDESFAVAGEDSSEEGGEDPAVRGPETMFPSSFGLSFCVDGSAKAVKVTARWGRYERTESDTLTVERKPGGCGPLPGRAKRHVDRLIQTGILIALDQVWEVADE